MITPIEIRQQSFKKALRGYDREEVDAFLLALSQEWARQLEAHRAVKDELYRVQTSYNTLKEVEGMLHKTLIQAEQSSRDTMESAKQRANLKMREAETEAQAIIRQGREERDRLHREITELSRKREQLMVQLKGFLSTQLDFVNTYEGRELPPSSEPIPKHLHSGFEKMPELPQVEEMTGSTQVAKEEVKEEPKAESYEAPQAEAPKEEAPQMNGNHTPNTNGKQVENIFESHKKGVEDANLLEDIMKEL